MVEGEEDFERGLDGGETGRDVLHSLQLSGRVGGHGFGGRGAEAVFMYVEDCVEEMQL